ncbi:MAG: hypothetical protein HDT37_05240 [Clostridiales bacterium]|nr:hypothetical protein [Clostridiales bacterium]
MQEYGEKKFLADDILDATYIHRTHEADFSSIVEKICPKNGYSSRSGKGYDDCLWGKLARKSVVALLSQLSMLIGEFKSCDECLPLALVCDMKIISTYIIKESAGQLNVTDYSPVEFCLSDMGESDNIAVQRLFLSLATHAAAAQTNAHMCEVQRKARQIISSYLPSGDQKAAIENVKNIDRMASETLTVAEVVRPLLTLEVPSKYIIKKYFGKTDSVLNKLECFIHNIPYLSEESRKKCINDSKAEVENILKTAQPRQLVDYHWIIPLRELSMELSSRTEATFTFGVLLK